MAKVLPSPFERASKLRGSHSSPAAQEGWTIPKLQESNKDEGFRPFESPEAVKGFMLQAYRPCSLPVAIPKSAFAGVDDDSASASSTSSLDDVFAAQLSMTPHLPWPDLNSGAVSIAGSPLLRTDIPLCRFQKPKDCTRARRESMDICSSLQSQLILSARSASAPATYESVDVEIIWRKMPQQHSFNPFANVPDSEGFFSD